MFKRFALALLLILLTAVSQAGVHMIPAPFGGWPIDPVTGGLDLDCNPLLHAEYGTTCAGNYWLYSNEMVGAPSGVTHYGDNAALPELGDVQIMVTSLCWNVYSEWVTTTQAYTIVSCVTNDMIESCVTNTYYTTITNAYPVSTHEEITIANGIPQDGSPRYTILNCTTSDYMGGDLLVCVTNTYAYSITNCECVEVEMSRVYACDGWSDWLRDGSVSPSIDVGGNMINVVGWGTNIISRYATGNIITGTNNGTLWIGPGSSWNNISVNSVRANGSSVLELGTNSSHNLIQGFVDGGRIRIDNNVRYNRLSFLGDTYSPLRVRNNVWNSDIHASIIDGGVGSGWDVGNITNCSIRGVASSWAVYSASNLMGCTISVPTNVANLANAVIADSLYVSGSSLHVGETHVTASGSGTVDLNNIGSSGGADLEASTNVVPVFVAFGQSNETGYNVDAMTTFGTYTNARASVVYTMFDDWVDAVPDIVTSALQIVNGPTNLAWWGSEMIAGNELADIYSGQRLAWVKNCKAGEQITNWSPGSFGWTRITNAITLTTSFLTANGFTPDVRWFSICQGEAEMASGVNATNWASYATNVLQRLRDLYNPSAHVAVVRTHNGTGTVSRVAYSVVTQQQALAASSMTNASLISTDGFAVSAADGAHFTGQGLIDFGLARLADIRRYASDVTASRTFYADHIAGDIAGATIAGDTIGEYVASQASGSATAFFNLRMTSDFAVPSALETNVTFDTETEDAGGVHSAGVWTFPAGVVQGTFVPVYTNGFTGGKTVIHRWLQNANTYHSMYFEQYGTNLMTGTLMIKSIPFTLFNDSNTNMWRLVTYHSDADPAKRKLCGGTGTAYTRITGYVVPR